MLVLGVKVGLILVVRSQIFEYLCETLYKHALEHLEAACSEKNGSFFVDPLTIIDLFEVL